MAHVDVRSDNFDTEVIARSYQVPVVVDFWADWCGPCRVLGPVLERLADESGGSWALVKIDTTRAPDLAQEFGIQGIPAVKAFVDGQVVDEFVGALPEGRIRDWLKGFVVDEADELVTKGDAARQSDPEVARARYAEALGLREHPAALLGLAELSPPTEARALLGRLPVKLDGPLAARKAALELAIEAGDVDPAELRRRVAANPDDLDARWALAHAHAARGDHETALELLLELVRSHRSFRDDGARKAMLAIFDAIGSQTPLVHEYRRKLTNVLF